MAVGLRERIKDVIREPVMTAATKAAITTPMAATALALDQPQVRFVGGRVGRIKVAPRHAVRGVAAWMKIGTIAKVVMYPNIFGLAIHAKVGTQGMRRFTILGRGMIANTESR